jgi:NDP-sugar pyrophosphorylase family protein
MTYTEQQTSDIDVVILCGGLGSRLKSVVADRPKPMAIIGERPFLAILIDRFRSFGFRRFVLCTGYMSEAVEAYFVGPTGEIEVVISREPQPLGTAGAVKLAESHIRSDPFLVANGDSFCPVDLAAFVRFHQARGAVLSMAVAPSRDPKDYGTVIVDADQRIVGFKEKAGAQTPGHINAGLYLFSRQVLASLPEAVKTSLECDLFPRLVGRRCYAFMGSNPVLDIGTPERFEIASRTLAPPSV